MTDSNPVGRPLKFKDVAEMQVAIDAYFAKCDARKSKVYVKSLGEMVDIENPEPYTMAGLAQALEIDRKTLLNYESKDEFFLTIKKARQKVEAQVELRSMETPYTSGCIFNLKNNFDWKDKTEQEIVLKDSEILDRIKNAE